MFDCAEKKGDWIKGMSKEQVKIRRLTREEIRAGTLEQLRQDLVVKLVTNEVFLDALKAERKKSGNESDMNLVKNIRNREATEVALEGDLKMVEAKINEGNV